MSPERRLIAAVVALMLSTSCATKAFIRGPVGEVSQRVDQLSATTEETAERARRNEERLGQLDSKASAAGAAASQAQSALAAAQDSLARTQVALAMLERRLESVEVSQKIPPTPPVPPAPPTKNGSTPQPADLTALGSALGAIETYRAQLVGGRAAISAPEKMIVGQSGDAVLVVSAKRAADELSVALQSATPGGSVRIVETVRLSKTMRAKLAGTDFDVTPLNSEEQTGVIEEDVSWKWEIRPLKPGKLRLNVTLTAVLRIDGRDTTRDEEVLSREIVVEAAPAPPRTWQDAAHDLWSDYKPPADFIYGTLLTGAVAWLWSRWTRRRRPPSNSAASSPGFE